MAKAESEPVLIICEAGVNHNGSLRRAMDLVEAAAHAGADVVKFQTFSAESLVSATALKAAYQERNAPDSGSQFEMLKGLELDLGAHRALRAHCELVGIKFLSTPFDSRSARMLVNDIGQKILKVSSGDLTNAPLLLEMAQAGVELILSTGMATIDEVEEALGVIAFGYLGHSGPTRGGFRAALESNEGRDILRRQVSILHCTSDYPASFADVNLKAMDTLRDRFGLRTGYSDHTEGIAVSLAAVARGAQIIEKHMTLDRNLPGPDHRASIEPVEFADMVCGIRVIEQALGSPDKLPTEGEMQTRVVARKTIVAARPIAAGELFSLANLTTKRAEGSLAPISIWELLGRPAGRGYCPDEGIEA